MRTGNQPSAPMLAVEGREALPAIYLSRAALHPFVYRRRIQRVEGHPKAGQWVAVYAQQEDGRPPQLFAYGLYNDRSEIAVRLYRWWGELPDDSFWEDTLQRAVSLRREILGLDASTNTYRVLHAEADGVSGLVVDRYCNVLSAESFSFAMHQRAPELLERLAKIVGTEHWLVEPSPMFANHEGYSVEAMQSSNLPSFVTVEEQGVKFRIHFATGHKTGFFCDQRENRMRLGDWCQGKSVLDLCCYSGGFAVHAAKRGQAAEITGVDIDEEPLQLAKKNADINQVRVRWVRSDVFAFMRDMIHLGRQYDIVVLDPPKLIRTRDELEEGTRKHHDLNKLAMQLVRPGGWMLSCSCAGLLSHEAFGDILRSASRATGQDEHGERRPPRTVQILGRYGAAADHPVAINCPETDYLKSAWMRVW